MVRASHTTYCRVENQSWVSHTTVPAVYHPLTSCSFVCIGPRTNITAVSHCPGPAVRFASLELSGAVYSDDETLAF